MEEERIPEKKEDKEYIIKRGYQFLTEIRNDLKVNKWKWTNNRALALRFTKIEAYQLHTGGSVQKFQPKEPKKPKSIPISRITQLIEELEKDIKEEYDSDYGSEANYILGIQNTIDKLKSLIEK